MPRSRSNPTVFFVAALLTLTTAGEVQAQDDSPRVPSTADYGKWERLGGAKLSPDGKFLTYDVRRNDGENKLHLRATKGSDKKDFKYGSRARFSGDSKWVAFRIGMSEKASEKLKKAKKPVQSKLGLHSLETGKTTEIKDIASFEFSDDGKFLLMRRYKPKGQKHNGVDTLVRDLATSRDTNFGNVASYKWADKGSMLALILDAKDKVGNGVLVYDAQAGRLRTLDSAGVAYSSLTWRKDAADLAVLKDRLHEKDEDASFVVMTWRGLETDSPKAKSYDHVVDTGFPKDMRVVSFAGLRWSEDGETVFFGIKAWDNKPAKKKKKQKKSDDIAEATTKKTSRDKSKKDKTPKTLRESLKDPAGVEVWHAKDIDIQPRQRKTHTQIKNRNFLASWWIESDNFVQLGDELTERVSLSAKQTRAFGFDNTPYESIRRFGPRLFDVYVIDISTGAKTKVLDKNKLQYGASPNGRFLLYVKNAHIWSYDLEQSKHRNLTSGTKTSFVNRENSSLTDEKPAYGVAGWREDSSHAYVYSRYDIWKLSPEGKGVERITDGAEQRIRYRRVVLDREEDKFIRDDRPMYFSIYGDVTKKSGYMRAGEQKKLIWKDKRISGLVKAKDADVFAYVEESFADSPNVFVTDASMTGGKQLSETNEFQKDYDWGHSVLVNYKNVHGADMQGALYYPAGYKKGKKYPMIVYIYELRSQNLHRYSSPSERSAYNPAVFTTQGYFVLQPDIVYRAQNPGLSAVECVVPAVKSILARGEVDPKKVGLVGHSWGAYQTAFIVTQTDIFAAGVAGAPLTNMMSMSMSIYWNTGGTDARIFHESQGRMDRPFWKDVDTYIKNSPIFSIDNLNTPLLVAFGDKDGAVDWHQGIEMYNAARLAQKPFVMLVYPGENHGLRKKPNQVDYHHRVREWFDHHLKGTEPKGWITKGKSHLKRQKELDVLKKKNKKGGEKNSEDSKTVDK